MRAVKSLTSLPKDASYDVMGSPVGPLAIITSPEGLHAVLWDNDTKNDSYAKIIQKLTKSNSEKTIIATKKQLDEYFQGIRKSFDLPLALYGTAFQLLAWNQLLKIPYSETLSYKEQAEKIGDHNKARAVGMANGLNPISIIVPCHRVIGSNGKLVGFGGGLEAKDYLLKLEKSNV